MDGNDDCALAFVFVCYVFVFFFVVSSLVLFIFLLLLLLFFLFFFSSFFSCAHRSLADGDDVVVG